MSRSPTSTSTTPSTFPRSSCPTQTRRSNGSRPRPPATMTEIPSFGLDGVGKALGLAGPSLLQVTLESLLGVPLPPAVLGGDAQITGFVQAAGPLDVSVPTRVEQTDAGGNVNVLWDAGPSTLAPTDVPRF